MSKSKDNLVCIALAAGQGKRMRSKRAKVLHSVAGRPMIQYVLGQAAGLNASRLLIVVGHQGEAVRQALSHAGGTPAPSIDWVPQETLAGTGHAVQQARPLLGDYEGTVVILNGDQPLLTGQTLARLLAVHREKGAALTLLTARLSDPRGYGRVLRDSGGRVTGVVEEADASEEQRKIPEINIGVYAAQTPGLFSLLEEVRPDNAQGEYYLTDIVRLAVQKGQLLCGVSVLDPEEALGINTRADLSRAEKVLRRRIAERWMAEGVTLVDPETTRIDSAVTIGRDTVIYPFTMLEGETAVGEDCVIASHVRIISSRLGNGVVVKDHCVISEAVLEDEASVGPFSHLRPAALIRRRARVGNFVEIKKAELGEESKANHLSYLGDAVVGKGVNIGAGTITCNYDGTKKSRTIIEDQVFVGSDTQFIAPVRVGRGATIAAGSTVTQDVPPDALAIARSPQVNKKEWNLKKKIGKGKRRSSASH